MDTITLQANGRSWQWHDQWAQIPDTPAGRINGRTHAVAALDDGRVAVFHQSVPALLIFDEQGKLLDSWGDRFIGAHGLSITREYGAEQFWLVDQLTCEVCRVDLKGNLQQRLAPPPVDVRPNGKYTPTEARQNPANGDIWLADGYGGAAVYRYAKDGRYLGQLTGEEGAGRFVCPHGIAISPDNQLFVADRNFPRIAVYDDQGKFIKSREDVAQSPCGLDFHDGLIVIPELRTGVKLLDAKTLDLVAEFGADPRILDEKQRPANWPNLTGTGHIKPGLFNSPHGGCFAPNGDIYIVEWILGGRITKLKRMV